MSTAHRPTWNAKSGGGGLRDGATAPPTLQHSAKDQPGHRRLKYLCDTTAQPVGEHADFFASHLDGMDDSKEEAEDKEYFEGAKEDNGIGDEDAEGEEECDSEDEAALLAELEKIRAERAAQQSQVAAPATGAFGIKRRWEEEGVVFRRPAGSGTRKTEKRFINDTIRSDYHRSFIDRYVK